MGQRITNQRVAILDFLEGNHTHPTAQDIYEAVRAHLPHISKGTVYRNLDGLCTEGLVRAVPISGTSRYESVSEGPHDHFVCTGCERIIDVPRSALDDKAMAHLRRRRPDLKADGVVISWTGHCKQCTTEG